MRSLPWVGLVFSLLIVGVLGGLLAPLPSEAGTPILTLEVDPDPDGTGPLVRGGTGPIGFLVADTLAVCTTTEKSSGYTQCYSVSTSATATGKNGRQYMAKAFDVGVTARLLLSDKSSGDAAKLTGVTFFPTTTNWATTEAHALQIIMTHTFDFAPNTLTAVGLGMRAGGMFVSGPTALTPNVTKNNSVKFAGKGKFQGATGAEENLVNSANPVPLSFTEGSSVQKSYFTLDQVIQYPSFACDSNGTATGTVCIPIITLTYDVTLTGPDSVSMTDSAKVQAVGCEKFSTHPKGGDKNAIRCHNATTAGVSTVPRVMRVSTATGKIIATGGGNVSTAPTTADSTLSSSLTKETAAEVIALETAGAVKGLTCAEAGVPCRCSSLDCRGTIVHVVKVESAGAGQEFRFKRTDDGTENNPFKEYSITPETTANGTIGEYKHLDLPTLGSQWTMVKLLPANWNLTSISCVSANYGNYADLQRALSNNGGDEVAVFTKWTEYPSVEAPLVPTGHRVDFLNGGDTLTCTWILSP